MAAIACAASGFIMALLISALAKNKEIIMTLLGVLIVAIIYLGYNFNLYMIMYYKSMSEVFWKYTLIQIGINGISLFTSALIGAWLVAKKRRARTQTDNDQQNDPQDKPQPQPIPDNNINL
jgi:membrane protein implicated in regulation of membrane protease activity